MVLKKNSHSFIPKGKRWTKETKDMFIDSLTKGYPIGSLLYKTQVDNVDVFTLIDGLQRGSSIKEYLSNPTKFFDISKISKEAGKNSMV